MQCQLQPAAVEPVYSEFADDPDFQELLELFTKSLKEKSGELQELFRAGKVAGIRHISHQLHGSGGGYGFKEVSRLAAELHGACVTESLEEIARAISQLTHYLDRIAA